MVGSLVENNKRKYDYEENGKSRKKVETYVDHQTSEISGEDEISVAAVPHGMSVSEQPDHMVSMPV